MWTRSRGLLRLLLGRYLACDPTGLRFAFGLHGKPALRGFEGVAFNLSHSDSLALYAFTIGAAVGVDIELLARRDLKTNYVTLARRAFGPEQARRLAALDPDTRRLRFLRAWVRHEAMLKCRGTGLLGADAATAPAGVGEEMPEPWVCEIDVGLDAVAAVAVDGAPRDLRRCDLGLPLNAT